MALAALAVAAFVSAGPASADNEPPPDNRANAEIQAACAVPSDADLNVIKVVYEVGLARTVSDKVMLAGFEAGWVESHMNNLSCGDLDSLGVFQQRPSQGWCNPASLCLDVAHASNSFFSRAQASEPGCACTAGQLAQSVQRSAFPERYDQAEGKARELIAVAASMVQPPQPPPSARRGSPSGFAAAWAPDRLDVFGRGGAGVPYHNYFDRAAGAGWPDWHSLAGATGLRSKPTVVSQYNGRLDIFAVGSDQKIKQWYFDRLGDNVWRGPGTLGDTTFAAPPSAISWDPGRIDLFARDTNNNLRHAYFQHGVTEGFTPWETLATGLGGDPVAVGWSAGRWDVFAVATNGRMRHWYFDRLGEARWLGPQELGTTTFQGTPAVASWDYGRIDVFGRDTNNNLRHSYFQRGTTTDFSPWATLGNGDLGSSPVAITQYNGRLDVFYVHRSTNKMRQMYFDRIGDNQWRGPGQIGDTTFTSTIHAVSWEPGRIDLFGVDTNNQMRHAYHQHGDTAGFAAWENLGGIFQ
jgi:hypothetical protein